VPDSSGEQRSLTRQFGLTTCGHDSCVTSVTHAHRDLAAATLRYAAILISEKEQPGSFWLNELAESFESGCQDRVLAQVVDG